NAYKFDTTVATDQWGLAKATTFEYSYNDGHGDKVFATTHSASEKVEKTFTRDATVTVKVTFSLPGGNTKTITAELCKKKITVKKKEVVTACQNLVASST